MSYETLLYEESDHVAQVTVNRPEVLNALDSRTLAELGDVCEHVRSSTTIRALIVTGAGRAFCSGGDLKETSFSGVRMDVDALDPNDQWAAKILAIDKPTIAAVNGVAAGGGLALALACDIRIASDRARFSAIFARIAMPAMDGVAWLLPRVVGESRALELLYTAEIIDAQEADRIGLVSRVVEHDALLSEATDLARKIATNAPVAVQLSKSVVGRSRDKSYLEHLPLQWEAMEENLRLAAHDIAEGGLAFREKRPARFRGLEDGN
jgi:2-(1,2-epoxy-1,2-dihydrophenyl)acetyl-CoA isomerase